MTPQKIGRYEVTKELGRGGMATVYLAHDPHFERDVAIKVLPYQLLTQTTLRQRFEREAKTIAALEHPAIVPVYDYSKEGNTPFLVMRLMMGGGLDARLKAGNFPVSEAIRVAVRVAQALDAAHRRGITHRDVKPSNVLFDLYDEAYLSDFGIVHLAEDSNLTNPDSALGTPGYMSPEQISSAALDGSSDMYSLGLMLFEMLTGKRPFYAPSAMQIFYKQLHDLPPHLNDYRPDLPLACDLLLERLLSREPAQRPGATAFIRLLNEAFGLPVAGFSAVNPAPISPPAEINTRRAVTPVTTTIPVPFQAPGLLPHFVNRVEQVAEIKHLLLEADNNVVGLVGLGGVGKTAVAVYLAHELRDQFPDGVLWGQLDSSTPEAILIGFAAAFGRAETIGQSTAVSHTAKIVHDILVQKKVLIILDSAEDSEQLKHLLPNNQENRIIITTRNRKMLTSLGAALVELAPFTRLQGVAFLEEAIGVERVTADKAAAQQITEQVGGLPLALGIVAGYLNEAPDLQLSEYVVLLQDQETGLESLTDWEDANRSVMASFELSYRALPPAVQQVFTALAVFDGPDFNSEAVAAILRLPLARVKIDIGRLRSLSLLEIGLGERDDLTPIPAQDANRYRLHPLLKKFAHQKLGSGLEMLRWQAVKYFTGLAERCGYPDSYTVLDLEWLNILGAIEWAYHYQQWASVVSTALALTRNFLGMVGFMDVRGHWNQARQILSWARESVEYLQSPLAKANILANLGAFAVRQADFETAKLLLHRALQILQELPPDPPTLIQHSQVCDFLSQLTLQQDRQSALTWLQQGIALLEPLTLEAAQHQRGYLLTQMAGLMGRMGRLEEAIQNAETGLSLLPFQSTSARINGLNIMGVIAYLRGQTAESLHYFEQAVPQAQQLSDYRRLATLWLNIGNNYERQGKLRRAIEYSRKGLHLYQQMGDTFSQSGLHHNLAKFYFRLGQDDEMMNHLMKATDLANLHQLSEVEALVKSTLAEWQVVNEQYEAAAVTLARARALCEQLQLQFLRSTLIRFQAEVALGQGELAEALTAVEQALQLAHEGQDITEEGVCWRVKGAICYALDEPEEATAAFEQSVRLLRDQDSYELARSQMALAEDYLLQGEISRGEPLLRESLAAFEQLEAAREKKKVEEIRRRML